jgi:hypothetical protein
MAGAVNDLSRFVPRQFVSKAVESSLASPERLKVYDRLGDPYRVAEVVSPLGRLRRTMLAEPWSPHQPTADRIAEEVDIAIRLMTRFWLDSVMLAWRRWGSKAGDLRLDTRLMPQRPAGNEAAEWETWRGIVDTAARRLRSSIALTPADVETAHVQFCETLLKELNSGKTIGLPSGVQLHSAEDGAAIIPQRHQ